MDAPLALDFMLIWAGVGPLLALDLVLVWAGVGAWLLPRLWLVEDTMSAAPNPSLRDMLSL